MWRLHLQRQQLLLGPMLFKHLEKRQRLLIPFRLCRVKAEREEESPDKTFFRKRGRGKEFCFEVVGSLFTDVFDSKVLNAICVSLISVSLASFSRNLCVVEALSFPGIGFGSFPQIILSYEKYIRIAY